jgi:hypothetical protein
MWLSYTNSSVWITVGCLAVETLKNMSLISHMTCRQLCNFDDDDDDVQNVRHVTLLYKQFCVSCYCPVLNAASICFACLGS